MLIQSLATRVSQLTTVAYQFSYSHGDKSLVLEPLKGQIDPSKSEYFVGKVKVEVRFTKAALGRWGALVGDSPDRASPHTYGPVAQS